MNIKGKKKKMLEHNLIYLYKIKPNAFLKVSIELWVSNLTVAVAERAQRAATSENKAK